jgi:hypothetical protein
LTRCFLFIQVVDPDKAARAEDERRAADEKKGAEKKAEQARKEREEKEKVVFFLSRFRPPNYIFLLAALFHCSEQIINHCMIEPLNHTIFHLIAVLDKVGTHCADLWVLLCLTKITYCTDTDLNENQYKGGGRAEGWITEGDGEEGSYKVEKGVCMRGVRYCSDRKLSSCRKKEKGRTN